MGKMLFYVLFACFLLLTTAEEANTTAPSSKTTATYEAPGQNSEEAATTSATNGVPQSTIKSKEVLAPATESSTSSNVAAQENKTTASSSQSSPNETNGNTNDSNTTEVQTSGPKSQPRMGQQDAPSHNDTNMVTAEKTPNQTTVKPKETTTLVTEGNISSNVAVQENETIASPSQSAPNDTNGNTNDSNTIDVLSSPTVDQQDASPAPTIESVPATTSTLAVTPKGPSTVVVPTANKSATTQVLPTVQKTTSSSTTLGFLPTAAPIPKTIKPVSTISATRKPADPTVSPTKSTNPAKAVKHGKIVAGLIGGALICMLLGFLLILYKKHNLKKHQIATTDWAGPTPFLETGDGDSGRVTLRSSTKISLASFLPQRFSKRMSLLAESGEEMQDMQELTMGTTFMAKEEKSEDKNNKKVEKTEKSASEGTNENSENSTQTEDLLLVNETKENGEAKSKELENGQAITNEGEKGQSEDTSAQPGTAEEPPKEQNNEKQEESGKDGADSVV